MLPAMVAFAASFYPPLHERAHLPALYLPTCFLLSIFPFLCQSRLIAVSITFPVLLILVVRAPCYTLGDPSSDYYNSGPFVAILLWYLDFVVFTPRQGPDAPVFRPSSTDVDDSPTIKSVGWSDLDSVWKTTCWAFRLMLPPNRGIGWNWQVRSVPPDHAAELQIRDYVMLHTWFALSAYLRSALMLFVLGFGSGLQQDEHFRISVLVDALIGWAGAIWVWDRLNCFYSLAAAVAVACGLCQTWEWPPLMGSIRDAWSIRQMWSVVYHQVLRRMLQQPSLRVVRALGLKKGSLLSKYSQLYLSFAISCVFHQFQMFNVTRRDCGESAFFMSQPVAITVEDLAQSLCSGYFGRASEWTKFVGYVWTLLWFSCTLPIYIKALHDAGIISDIVFGMKLSDAGSSAGKALLRHPAWNTSQ